jgi:hypothetical protein
LIQLKFYNFSIDEETLVGIISDCVSMSKGFAGGCHCTEWWMTHEYVGSLLDRIAEARCLPILQKLHEQFKDYGPFGGYSEILKEEYAHYYAMGSIVAATAKSMLERLLFV